MTPSQRVFARSARLDIDIREILSTLDPSEDPRLGTTGRYGAAGCGRCQQETKSIKNDHAHHGRVRSAGLNGCPDPALRTRTRADVVRSEYSRPGRVLRGPDRAA